MRPLIFYIVNNVPNYKNNKYQQNTYRPTAYINLELLPFGQLLFDRIRNLHGISFSGIHRVRHVLILIDILVPVFCNGITSYYQNRILDINAVFDYLV